MGLEVISTRSPKSDGALWIEQRGLWIRSRGHCVRAGVSVVTMNKDFLLIFLGHGSGLQVELPEWWEGELSDDCTWSGSAFVGFGDVLVFCNAWIGVATPLMDNFIDHSATTMQEAMWPELTWDWVTAISR